MDQAEDKELYEQWASIHKEETPCKQSTEILHTINEIERSSTKKLPAIERRKHALSINTVGHYDSSMRNAIVEHKKILRGKNYELDSRAYGLKDYGYQPLFAENLRLRRAINQEKQPEPSGFRLPKNYTPITVYMKSLKDSRISKHYGPNNMVYRPNLNVS